MNPKFALLVDTTEALLQAVVATAPISPFAFDHTDAITLSEGKALSRTSGSTPGQLSRAGSDRTKWWPGGRHAFILHSHYAPEGNRPKICLWRWAC